VPFSYFQTERKKKGMPFFSEDPHTAESSGLNGEQMELGKTGGGSKAQNTSEQWGSWVLFPLEQGRPPYNLAVRNWDQRNTSGNYERGVGLLVLQGKKRLCLEGGGETGGNVGKNV